MTLYPVSWMCPELISSLHVAVPSPNPQGETEATERLRKPDTFRVQ